MADIIVDGLTRVSYVPTIANPPSPTAAELSAGSVLHDTLIPAGLEGFEAAPAEVDNTAFGSTFDTKLPGTAAFSGTRLVLKKQSGTDTLHATLTAFNTAGYIVVRDGFPKDTAFASADKVQVYPIRTGTWSYMARARNEVLKYWVATPISDAPALSATVAA